MGAYLNFLPDGDFQVIGKYLMGAGYEINGDYLITDGKIVFYFKELQPNFGNISYNNISWKLDYISKLDNPWFNSYLIQYFEDGEQRRFYNYNDPVAMGTILQYRGVTIERISNVSSVNVNNVYIRDSTTDCQ